MAARSPLGRFLAVGTVAYLLDVGVFLTLTETWQTSLELARVSAFVVTVLVTYWMNGRYTFQAQLSAMGLGKYIGVQVLGTLLNLGFFWLAIQPEIALAPILGLTIGSMLGSTFNFIAMRKLVFTDTPPTAD